ncbi:MAG: tetratricopeptide repeat protein, partial [Candidatus Acidoferrales bacterium]
MRLGTTRWLLVGLLCLALWTTAHAQQTQWEKLIGGGMEAYERGRYAEAEKLWLAALKEAETFGGEDPRLATSLNNLAAIYDEQGKYAQAEPLYQRALAIREKTLGPELPELATSLNNLALLYDNQGKYAQAEPLYQRS